VCNLDILIPAKNSAKKLPLTLSGLVNQTYYSKSIKIFLRDEGDYSAMDSREVRQLWDIVSSMYTTVYLRKKKSNGIVEARQDLLRVASGDNILWLDDDIILPNNFLEKTRDFLHSKESCNFGFVIPIILDADNVREHADYNYTGVKTLEEHRKLGHSRNYTPCEESALERIYRGNGGCMLVNTHICKQVVKYNFSDITKGEGEDLIASTLLVEHAPCYLNTGLTVHHLSDVSQRWRWTTAITSVLKMFLRDRVSKETMEKSGLEDSFGYKKV